MTQWFLVDMWYYLGSLVSLVGLVCFVTAIVGYSKGDARWCRRCMQRVDGLYFTESGIVCPECGHTHTRKPPRTRRVYPMRAKWGFGMIVAFPITLYAIGVNARSSKEGWASFIPTTVLALAYPNDLADAFEPGTFGNSVHRALMLRKHEMWGWQRAVSRPKIEIEEPDLLSWVRVPAAWCWADHSAPISVKPVQVSDGLLLEEFSIEGVHDWKRARRFTPVLTPAHRWRESKETMLDEYARAASGWIHEPADSSGTIDRTLTLTVKAVGVPFEFERTFSAELNATIQSASSMSQAVHLAGIEMVSDARLDAGIIDGLFRWDVGASPPQFWVLHLPKEDVHDPDPPVGVTIPIKVTILFDGVERLGMYIGTPMKRSKWTRGTFDWVDLHRMRRRDLSEFRERVRIRVEPDYDTAIRHNLDPIWVPSSGDEALEFPFEDVVHQFGGFTHHPPAEGS